jgi:hypothetical protein
VLERYTKVFKMHVSTEILISVLLIQQTDREQAAEDNYGLNLRILT